MAEYCVGIWVKRVEITYFFYKRVLKFSLGIQPASCLDSLPLSQALKKILSIVMNSSSLDFGLQTSPKKTKDSFITSKRKF